MPLADWLNVRMFNMVHGHNLVYNTCWEDPRLDRIALEIGADDYIVKPFRDCGVHPSLTAVSRRCSMCRSARFDRVLIRAPESALCAGTSHVMGV